MINTQYKLKVFTESKISILFLLILLTNNFHHIFQNIFRFKFNEDEFQHTHIAWNINQGMILYKDFWEHHGPLYSLFNGFILSILENPASFDTLILFRMISFLSTIFTLIFIFLISYNLLNKNLFFSCLSLFIYSSWDVVNIMAVQIRPDILQNTFMLVGVFLILQALENKNILTEKPVSTYNRNNLFFFAGLAFGIMLMFNFKSIIIIIALGATSIIHCILYKNFESIKQYGIILFGVILPSIIVSIYFLQNNAYNEFLQHSILNNFKMISERTFPEFAKQLLIEVFLKKDLLLTILTALALFNINFKDKRHLTLACIFIFSLYGTFKGLFLHYCLIYLPICSILISLFLYRIAKSEVTIFQISFNKYLYILLFCLMYKGFLNGIHRRAFTNAYDLQKKIIIWSLEYLKRKDVIFRNSNLCPAFIFNKDYGYRSELQSIHDIDISTVQGITDLGLGKAPEKILRDFYYLKINDEYTNLMVRK